MNTSLLSLFALLLLLATGCDPDAAGSILNGTDEPTVSYSETNLKATFFTEGSSPTPSLSWNGDQGTVSLSGEPAGVSVNSTTGRINWERTLPPGEHTFDVVVSNSEGQVVVPMTLENPLSGNFDGTYGGAYDFRMEIMEDGSITLFADGETARGSWQLENDKFTAYYTYDNYPDIDYTLLADVLQSSASASLVGDYYNGRYEAGDSPINQFEVTLQ
jgi:hypothetical protein